MGNAADESNGPDLKQGVLIDTIQDGAMLRGHADGEPALVVRRGDEFYAIGALCTHYGAPLETGLLVGDTVRCPWHHACFSLCTGQALRAPALDNVPCWRTEMAGGKVYLRERLEPPRSLVSAAPSHPRNVVIIGGGGAGNAAAEMLRRESYKGRLAIISDDNDRPCDRPNLSKGYLAGSSSNDSNPLRAVEFYHQHHIDLKLNTHVTAIEPTGHCVRLDDGSQQDYDVLLLATGAEPVRLDIPGADLPHVRYLRTQADSEAMLAAALKSKRVVIVGASFIGMEVAAALRTRKLEVHVVAPDSRPMERVLGPEVGDFFFKLHSRNGVHFHLGTTATAVDDKTVTLKSGERIEADLVVIGIGVRPRIALAEQAGIAIDRGVVVNEYLETSIPGIYAVGDIARWPDPHTGENIRVEHWVVAERQGQVAARNILGMRERFDQVPFFWTEQYDFGLAYVGHAERWDRIQIDGDFENGCTLTYMRDDRELAVAVAHRDLEGLRFEVEAERAKKCLPMVDR